MMRAIIQSSGKWLLPLTISLLPLALQAADSSAPNEDTPSPSSDDVNTSQASNTPRFSMYKRNYVLWSIPDDAKDERGLQIRFSAQYRFLECTNNQKNGISQGTCAIFDWKPLTNYVGRLNVAFSYTTDFDFYIRSEGSRELGRQSRPVRNRMTSPAFHFNWEREEEVRSRGIQYRSFTWSFVHHSNGQDLEFESLFSEASTDAEIRDTITEIERENPAWMDSVSRGWNYIELLTRFDAGIDIPNCEEELFCVTLVAGARFDIFTEPANPIWWEPGNDTEYLDYNRLYFQLINDWGKSREPNSQFLSTGKKRFALELKCGLGGCSSNASLRADIYVGEGNFQLPLMVYGHFGRNEHFYNYHERADMIGIGLEFSQ